LWQPEVAVTLLLSNFPVYQAFSPAPQNKKCILGLGAGCRPKPRTKINLGLGSGFISIHLGTEINKRLKFFDTQKCFWSKNF